MKAYTDLEQSKELVKILPADSADMKFPYFGDGQYGTIPYVGEPIEFSGGKDIPCWSLAALLGVLPKGTRLLKSATDDTYHCDCPKGNINKWYDNPVDACYNMIIWLHE